MPPRPHLAVKIARGISPRDLATKLAATYATTFSRAASVEFPFGPATSHLDVYNLKTLPAEIRSWIWTLFEQNMKPLYEQSPDGWDEKDKRKELFHAESRFLVLRSAEASLARSGDSNSFSGCLGYTIFRFDTEETAGEEDADVVYCYELQVSPKAHGKGVGRMLMDALLRIGRETKMDKIMLTVFKANGAAIAFYRKIGYEIDEIDPSKFEEADDVDYSIMSLNLAELQR